MAEHRRILVTGSAGALGRAASVALLQRGHWVRAFDRVASPHASEVRVGDLTDKDAVERSVEGVDTVVHLGATPDEADFIAELLPNNIVGLYRVCEAVRAEGVQRLVLTSSGQVAWGSPKYGEQGYEPIAVEDGIAPVNMYGITKVLAEAMGEMYSRCHGLSVVVVRPGWLPREPWHVAAMSRSRQAQAQYFSPGDVGRFFVRAVETPGIRIAVVNATSRPNGPAVWDITTARELLGYEPEDTYPQGLPFPPPEASQA
ncbi:NAD(P)-dependent oxidoreductase [Candidatus Poribacteria bacterium]|nr:NAD(P)-dependent oxidoreductase [Candidatus Poribacteria bacterium]